MTNQTTKKAGELYDSASYKSDYLPEKSIYQDDSRIFHRGGYEYATVVEIIKAQKKNGTLICDVKLSNDEEAFLAIRFLKNNTLRIQSWQGDTVFDEYSDMIWERASLDHIDFFLSEHPDKYSISYAQYILNLYKSPFTITIAGKRKEIIFELETERIAGQHTCAPLGFRKNAHGSEPYVSWRIKNTDRFFGFGEKWNKVEKSSTRTTIWSADTCGSNTNDMSYKAVPVLYCTSGWGIMAHTSFRTKWEVGTFSYTAGSLMSEDSKLDVFLFLGETLKSLIGQYTTLSGRPSMPPKWALGIWMSRCQYMDRGESDAAVEGMRSHNIPCDVIHLDPLWMKTHYYYEVGVDACDFVRNEQGFGNLKTLFKEYADKGYNTCLWINPYLPENTPIYDEACEKDYLLKTLNGKIARLEHGNPVGTVDFSNPAALEWWKEYLRGLVKDGASVFKPDYGDRTPELARYHNGRTGKEMHNMYLYYFTKAAYDVVKEVTGKGMVWRRAGYIGSQRYPGTWAGDTQVTWQGLRGALRGGLSAGFVGEAFWASDIGGFVGPKPDEELYIRWVQLGMLSPLTRFHGTTPREPWHFGEGAIEITRTYANLRYSLMPYLLAAVHEATENGLPLMRHLAIEFPEEPNIETIDDQYMIGNDIMVAPIINPGQTTRDLYLPAGNWFDWYDPAILHEGRSFITVDAPVEHLPIFVREGALIPCYEKRIQHLKEPCPEEIVLKIFPGDSERTLVIDEEERCNTIRYRCQGGEYNLETSNDKVVFKVITL